MSDPADLVAFLDAHHVAHLATAGADGPHTAPVFYARVGVGLVWISAPHVLHSEHLAADPRASASVAPSAPSLGHVEGAQLRGVAEAPEDQTELRDAWLARFPLARPMLIAAPDHRFYVLRPTWARLVRTVAGVSRNREWTFP